MNKKNFFVFIMLLVLFFCACSDNKNQNDSINIKDEKFGEVFSNDLFEGTESVTFYDFNETKYTSYDKDIINELVNMLVTAKLTTLDEDDYVEGSYMISLNKSDIVIDIGLGNVIAYEGKQYRSNITGSQVRELVNRVKETASK